MPLELCALQAPCHEKVKEQLKRRTEHGFGFECSVAQKYQKAKSKEIGPDILQTEHPTW